MATRRQYMVGQNAPGCLPDTTEPLPIYDSAEDALDHFKREVKDTIEEGSTIERISDEEAAEVLGMLDKITVEELSQKGMDQFMMTVAGHVHFIHIITSARTDTVELPEEDEDDLDPIRETKVESLVDLINFIRKNYHIIPECRIHRYQFPDGERNGLIFAVLLVAGIKYDDGVQQRPTQEWSDGHDAAYELVMDLTLDPEAAANRLLDMGDAV